MGAWAADELVWIVRGKGVAEDYVRALLGNHAPTLDRFDQQGMTGDLFDDTPSVPGFKYWDLPRDVTIGNISNTALGDCVGRIYLGYVLPEGAEDTVYEHDDLSLWLAKAGGECVDNGELEDVAEFIASRPGVRAEEIGGRTVYRDEQTMTALVGDVVVALATARTDTFVEMAGFIESFLAGQPA